MIAVIYARYSSDLQRAASIRLYREFVTQQGWDYRHAYTDRAISGASALRPAYQAVSSVLRFSPKMGFENSLVSDCVEKVVKYPMADRFV